MANESTISMHRGNASEAGSNPNPTNTDTAAQPSSAKNIFDLLGSLATPSNLDAEGQKYLDTVKELLVKAGFDAHFERINGTNYEACVISYNRIGIALIFSSSYQNTGDLPVAAMRKDIDQRMKLINASIAIDQCIVVRPGMYSRANQMATHIRNEINAQVDPNLANVTVDAFGGDFVASADINAVRQFISARNPHDIPARDDIGLILYTTRQKPNQLGYGRPEVEKTPILAVTGYTTFILAPNVSMNGLQPVLGGVKYLPMTVITDIVSDFKSPAILATGISLAIEGFIEKQGWMAQFSSFAKNSPNVGRLITDENGQPWFAKDIAQRNEFFTQYLTSMKPLLAIDIQEGRAKIGAINNLIANSGAGFLAAMSTFTKTPIGGPNVRPFIQCYRSFDGVVTKSNQETVDSRSIDFLSLAVDIPRTSELTSFLQIQMDPRVTLANVKRHYPQGTESLYMTFKAVIDPNVFSAIAQAIGKTLHLTYDYLNGNQVYDITGLASAYNYNALSSLGFGVGQGNVGGWDATNPFIY